MTRWNTWTRLQPVQFEWEDEPQLATPAVWTFRERWRSSARNRGSRSKAGIENVESSVLYAFILATREDRSALALSGPDGEPCEIRMVGVGRSTRLTTGQSQGQ
jgi:hypothetical protein